jgi:hypothetical protein
MLESLKWFGRLASIGALAAVSSGFHPDLVTAAGGCEVPPQLGDRSCSGRVLNVEYPMGKYKARWIGQYDIYNTFYIESDTLFLGFLWETEEGKDVGVSELAKKCGSISQSLSQDRIGVSAVQVVNPNSYPGCLIKPFGDF